VSSEDRLADSVVEELSQTRARLGVCLFALVYLGGWSFFSGPVSPTIVWVVTAYGAFSLFWLLLIHSRPEPSAWRRVLVIFGDLGINTFFMHTLQEKGAFFYPMYLWIIVGNGVRFGPRYLLLATGVGVSYFLPMLAFSSYWKSNVVAGAGLLLGLIVLPVFYLSLIRRLHEANARLSLEVERSQAAARAKTEFLANMSHELLTPMNGVLGVADLMSTTDLSTVQKQYVALMQRSAQSLLHIIDDILDFSRIQAGRILLQEEPFNLRGIVEHVFDLLALSAEKKGLLLRLEFPLDAPSRFIGDGKRIRQILFNLLGNAVKFTEHGHVLLRIESSPEEDRRRLRLRVSDTGPGIPQEKLELIFDKFERAETRMGYQFGGTGLGLAISRHLARLMGGDITVHSEPDEGTTFEATILLKEPPSLSVVSLPEGQSTPSEEGPLEPPLGHSQVPLHVLVVEDEPVNRLVTTNLLEVLGISCAAAEDGEQALHLWRKEGETFDLVLMDMRLPGIDGLEATRRIRQLEGESQGESHRVPIVALTANVSKADEEACLGAGMDLFLKKPLLLRQLRATLETLRRRGLLPTVPR